MELIVAVFDDWGIGKDGTQPIALSADRKFFRETTKGAMVIVGRKTLADFPGGRPLKGRPNLILSATPGYQVEGAEVQVVFLAATLFEMTASPLLAGSFFFPFFGPCSVAHGIFVPHPGMGPRPPTVEAWSLNHWTTREAPGFLFL